MERDRGLSLRVGAFVLVDYLSGGFQSAPGKKRFPTAALAHLRMPDDWAGLCRGAAELVRLQHVRDLPDGS